MSEVTRAEQLADWLDRCKLPYDPQDVADCSAELRRLSAVEARCVELEKVLNTDTKLQGKLTATVIHQAALLQQAKEAMQELNRYYSHIWDRVDGCAVIMPHSIPGFESAVETHSAALSAINEWEKSK